MFNVMLLGAFMFNFMFWGALMFNIMFLGVFMFKKKHVTEISIVSALFVFQIREPWEEDFRLVDLGRRGFVVDEYLEMVIQVGTPRY